MSKRLFDEFPEVSAKMWKQKIQFDLKGGDYNALIWNTPEGIDVKPFYHTDEIVASPSLSPGPAHWKITQAIFAAREEKTNQKVKDVLNCGAESIWLTIPSEETGLSPLLEGIDLSSTPFYFDTHFLSPGFVKKLNHSIPSLKNRQVHIHTDIIGHLARSGNWFYNLEKDHNLLREICTLSGEFSTVISVDLSLYQNAGATMVQQLAYALAHANEYLNFTEQEKLSTLKQQKIVFKTAVGSNYFFEIAKLRALRLLWSTLASEYDALPECHILVQPSRRNKTLYDYNVNMLRTTTESMSAILGGADAVCNLPYDAIYHKDNEFAERIARNQLLILKHESYFDKAANPADGAYYIEDITTRLAEKALDIFRQIEAGGGFLKQLKDHTIQKKIKESARAEQQEFDKGQEVLIGTNKYPNPEDRMKENLELYPFVKTHTRKTLIEPIIERRLSEQIEQDRLKQESH
ncbi:methylmalonyl-CoA mutase subunit beta [Sinomicrobium weinanense]|uniref:Methylmalonyl-CoA mutase subunit beta n=1 Tax=Sinomicrobium weinanense TaxID=2842200 RepID=A0A926JUT2_9FLAO|nr:methylmalonyl-CoA mutase subunit beta [Sinomicrobium weinanense]MBC9797953.1 methylmalonyl-CoA mutase subunit beta [Sinomicrobium weinanense]MBU3123111.1 methylmalonyl-CoA mutase subunit beta [Sinomicrobium weinanense]